MAIPNIIKYMQILNNIGLSLNSAPILRRYKNINIDNINQSGFGYINVGGLLWQYQGAKMILVGYN